MIEAIASVLMVCGSLFSLLAAIGVLRLPDIFMRMHAATKAGTLGAGFILTAEALTADDMGTTIKAVAILVFLLLTAPVAAHLIARAAYHRGVSLYAKTWIDELDAAQKERRPKSKDPDGPLDRQRHHQRH